MDRMTESFTIPEVIENEMSEPTAQLRWSKDGKLQQALKITVWRNGKLADGRYEWCDVPTEA